MYPKAVLDDYFFLRKRYRKTSLGYPMYMYIFVFFIIRMGVVNPVSILMGATYMKTP